MIVTYEACPKCGDLYCEPCPLCQACGACACEPPVISARGFEGRCEACGDLVQVDQRVRIYADDIVVHETCPRPRAEA